MLRLEGVEIVYDDWRLTADLALERGSATALIGPSGAGKSTLIAAIAGFLAPARGRILWEERDLTPLGPGARPITLVFQEHNLFAHLTAAQNVGLGLRPDLRLGRDGWARVEGALAAVGLAGMGNRRPAALSGGERSRVALARAILRDRPLLILDEPFAALGPALRDEMLDLVDRIRAEQGATLLMVTHQPADALRIAPQTVVVDDGRALPPAPTAALLADPPPGLAAYLGDGERSGG
ncbi:ATP-binding cassette domain-containing protein [Amaricoccus sp.]|uniref:thiamine ABC transporter ATP-binding protein n=1 Tax=Amaricoccus sp. TaxID=1872485 RepID=UPI001B484CA9|nr:ATP-binding cassette domain-containing protein [Amaricoccus sp.]MBP7003695.1 ATP-binding cassette domain-containing protein [Amaricoccus sp.]